MAGRPGRRKLIAAIDHALSGEWEKAHDIVKAYESDANACLIHAVLHRQRGERENAMYWYHQAGQMTWPNTDPDGQLLHLREQLGHQL